MTAEIATATARHTEAGTEALKKKVGQSGDSIEAWQADATRRDRENRKYTRFGRAAKILHTKQHTRKKHEITTGNPERIQQHNRTIGLKLNRELSTEHRLTAQDRTLQTHAEVEVITRI